MYILIERFMARLTKEQVADFAFKNNVNLSNDELDFTYDFIIKNWNHVLRNPNALDFEKYKDKYSQENFYKIERLINEYLIKFKNYL